MADAPITIRGRVATACLCLGVAMLAWSSVALAQYAEQPDSGLSASTIISLGFGIIVSIGGAYLKGVNGRITAAEQAIKETRSAMHELRNEIAVNHYDKDEIREIIRSELAPLMVEIRHLYAGDAANPPRRTTGQQRSVL